MNLQIQQILPTYFDADKTQQSEIWGKNLQFEKGELIKIVAPSGSGKTSLMHFLYGMRHDYTGIINWNNKTTRTLSIEETATLRKDNFSIVFQDLRLFPEQTVFSNIDIKRQLNPYHPAEKIKEMAERLGIGSKLNSLAKTCSYGEQQRIAIIRSLMQPFDFLLLDEPFSHLDNANSEKAMHLMLEEANSRKAAIIFADLERVDYFPFQRIFHL
jgi:putative ABC transport system ATP-binding protein